MSNQFVYQYWRRTELGRRMIESENVSESDLLFLIPNNVKRMRGLPANRTIRKHKKKQYKNARKRFILSFRLFDLISEIIEETICSQWKSNDFIQEFVDYKNVSIGDVGNFIVSPLDNTKLM